MHLVSRMIPSPAFTTFITKSQMSFLKRHHDLRDFIKIGHTSSIQKSNNIEKVVVI